MLRRQRLRAAVDQPRHVGREIRHADTNVIGDRTLQPQGAVAVLKRNVGGQVNVFGTNEVRVLQLTHEQSLQGVSFVNSESRGTGGTETCERRSRAQPL